MPDQSAPPAETRGGFLAALAAFLIWGFVPLYFKLLGPVGPLEIVAQRVIWTVVLLTPLVVVMGKAATARAIFADWRGLGVYGLTTTLISVNWLVFVWAVLNGYVLESSLGYYINPLVNVALGVIFLAERLSRRQGVAIAIASAGVIQQVLAYGQVPWVALTLAFSFGFYALVRKKARIDPVVGLLVETALLAPFALAAILWEEAAGTADFIHAGAGLTFLLIGSGAVTSLPLLLFMEGARTLRLATLGLMQYISPSMHFAFALLLFDEAFTTGHLVMFACIWVGLVIFSWDAVAAWRQATAGARARAG
jgi:chloramphenicol-sensitive protein RarD